MNKLENYLQQNIEYARSVVGVLRTDDNKLILVLREQSSWNFGLNLISLPGGRVGNDPGLEDETSEEAFIREVREETGIEVRSYKKGGVVKFIFSHKPDWNQSVDIFIANEWKGELIEGEDTRPMVVDENNIPFEQMWDDNSYWIPKVLAGEEVNATFLIDEDKKVVDYIFEG